MDLLPQLPRTGGAEPVVTKLFYPDANIDQALYQALRLTGPELALVLQASTETKSPRIRGHGSRK